LNCLSIDYGYFKKITKAVKAFCLFSAAEGFAAGINRFSSELFFDAQ
jgi:hypothetical protein